MIGIAGGVENVNAIQGALNGRYMEVPITDNETATQLSELQFRILNTGFLNRYNTKVPGKVYTQL